MKTNKFGKLQKLLIEALAKTEGKGCPVMVLYALAFPREVYPFSYMIPVLLRLVHQRVIRVAWHRIDERLSTVYLIGKQKGRCR